MKNLVLFLFDTHTDKDYINSNSLYDHKKSVNIYINLPKGQKISSVNLKSWLTNAT